MKKMTGELLYRRMSASKCRGNDRIRKLPLATKPQCKYCFKPGATIDAKPIM